MSHSLRSQYRAFMGHNGWLPALIGIGALTAMGLAMLVASISDARRAGSVTADATVVVNQRRYPSDTNNKDHRFAIELVVDGQIYTAVTVVQWGVANDYEEGDQIPVQYDPTNPERIWIFPIRSSSWYGVGVWGGFWLALLMAWWCWGLWKMSAKTVKALASAERQTAVVTAHVDASGKKQDMSKVSIMWNDPDGMPMESKPMTPEKAAKYPVGSEIEIFVDRESQQPGRWVEDYR